MSRLINIDDIQSFTKIKSVKRGEISEDVINSVKELNEKTQIEPFIRSSIYDYNDTPHGPMEIVDILTTRLTVENKSKYSAFILKGKSFKTVNAQDVSHQIYRLKKINGIEVAIFAYTGNLLDQPQEEFITICSEIGCLYSIWDCVDLGRLFISEGFICPRDGEVIEGGTCSCGYSPEREELNIYQNEALKQLTTSHKLKQKAGLVVLPTGTGKTRISALDIKKHEYRKTLYLAHTEEILIGAEREFQHFFSKNEVKRITKKSELKGLKKVTLATIQLISKNLSQFDRNDFEYLIIDEFHHSAAKSYRNTIDYFNYDFLLGLTATPFRGDRQDIAQLCNGNYIISAELREAIESGILSPYHYFGCFDDIDYSKIEYRGESYDIRDLERALVIPERDEAVISKWKEKADNKSTIGFCCSQEHALRSCKAFKDAGIPSEVYLSFTTNRDEILQKFSSGELKVLFTVDVLNEGVDFPFVECLLFLRPTESKRIFLQQLGRGLRRSPGKSKVIVLDFIGNFFNAYKIVEYLGLTSYETEIQSGIHNYRSTKEIFNLPLNCEIHFDEKVIDIFCSQVINDFQNITRFNIARILIEQYLKLCIKLQKRAGWKDIDRYCILHSEVYKILFQTQANLKGMVDEDFRRLGI